MSFLPGLQHLVKAMGEPLPPYVVKQLKKANTIAEGIVLPHQLQSKEARLTRFGKMHTKYDTPKNGMLLINGVLTVFTLGVYAAVIGLAIQLAKEERARRIRDKLQRWDNETQTKIDAISAEADRLEAERQRLAKGGELDPNFIVTPEGK